MCNDLSICVTYLYHPVAIVEHLWQWLSLFQFFLPLPLGPVSILEHLLSNHLTSSTSIESLNLQQRLIETQLLLFGQMP